MARGQRRKYSLDAPLAPQGVDVVDDFLFHSKVGWCEQIASSLVVMARSVGIPARLATGFVSDSRDSRSRVSSWCASAARTRARRRSTSPASAGSRSTRPASVPLAGGATTNGSWIQEARHHALELGIFAAAHRARRLRPRS